MASTTAAYLNSDCSPSKKRRSIGLVSQLETSINSRSLALTATLDFVGFAVFLLVLFMVPA